MVKKMVKVDEETWFSLMSYKLKNGFKSIDLLIKNLLIKENKNQNETKKKAKK